MKLFIQSKTGNRGVSKKIVLWVLLLGIGMGILLHTMCSFRKFEAGLGVRVAEVVISYHIIILMMLVFVGMGLGLGVDCLIRHKKYIFRIPKKGSWAEVIMTIWGYPLNEQDHDSQEGVSLALPAPAIPEMPIRRGRKPTFPLERWIPIALKWENRDPIRDAFTLGELIAEHLGTNPDGSPIVSEQTYYSLWRQRAIDEIRKRAGSK